MPRNTQRCSVSAKISTGCQMGIWVGSRRGPLIPLPIHGSHHSSFFSSSASVTKSRHYQLALDAHPVPRMSWLALALALETAPSTPFCHIHPLITCFLPDVHTSCGPNPRSYSTRLTLRCVSLETVGTLLLSPPTTAGCRVRF